MCRGGGGGGWGRALATHQLVVCVRELALGLPVQNEREIVGQGAGKTNAGDPFRVLFNLISYLQSAHLCALRSQVLSLSLCVSELAKLRTLRGGPSRGTLLPPSLKVVPCSARSFKLSKGCHNYTSYVQYATFTLHNTQETERLK